VKRPLKRTIRAVDWRELSRTYRVSRCCYHWVSDASIAEALEHLAQSPVDLVDPAIPHTPETHRASIVLMMEAGVVFDPVRLVVVGRRAHLKDGHHRMRAYLYRRALSRIPAVVTEIPHR
jgi:hypothetical protein